MGGKSSTIYLGDLLRAVCELGVREPAVLKMLAEMLGFSLDLREEQPQQQQPTTTPGESTLDGRGPGGADTRRDGARRSQTEDVSDEVEDELPAPTPERRSIPARLTPAPGRREKWIPEVDPLPAQEDVTIGPPPFIPLLAPQWTRGILSKALATTSADGPLDIERATEMLARHERLERLPTLSEWTLRRGVQLLLDKSAAMMPFMRDQAWLLGEIRDVIGADRMRVLRFTGSPARGAGVGLKSPPPYEPPPPGTPIVLLTDLGISRPPLAADWADEDEWVEFAELAGHAQCPLVAFVPYKPDRWPQRLAQALTIVQWGRATTAATVAGLIKNMRVS
jgi:hypothetical protein